jgi:hypothetical protein
MEQSPSWEIPRIYEYRKISNVLSRPYSEPYAGEGTYTKKEDTECLYYTIYCSLFT